MKNKAKGIDRKIKQNKEKLKKSGQTKKEIQVLQNIIETLEREKERL